MENIIKVNNDEFVLEISQKTIKLSELEEQLANTIAMNIERQQHIDWVATLPNDKQRFVHVDPIEDTSYLEELINKLKTL